MLHGHVVLHDHGYSISGGDGPEAAGRQGTGDNILIPDNVIRHRGQDRGGSAIGFPNTDLQARVQVVVDTESPADGGFPVARGVIGEAEAWSQSRAVRVNATRGKSCRPVLPADHDPIPRRCGELTAAGDQVAVDVNLRRVGETPLAGNKIAVDIGVSVREVIHDVPRVARSQIQGQLPIHLPIILEIGLELPPTCVLFAYAAQGGARRVVIRRPLGV